MMDRLPFTGSKARSLALFAPLETDLSTKDLGLGPTDVLDRTDYLLPGPRRDSRKALSDDEGEDTLSDSGRQNGLLGRPLHAKRRSASVDNMSEVLKQLRALSPDSHEGGRETAPGPPAGIGKKKQSGIMVSCSVLRLVNVPSWFG
jgi:hypothetical protein